MGGGGGSDVLNIGPYWTLLDSTGHNCYGRGREMYVGEWPILVPRVRIYTRAELLLIIFLEEGDP